MDTQETIKKLFEYVKEDRQPYRKNYLDTVKKCYQFVELVQWSGLDASKLAELGVPEIAVDRINRGLDTIKGTWQNTGTKDRVNKIERGDEKVAELLDGAKSYVENSGDFQDAEEDSFDSMLHVGAGVRKYGYDPKGDGGFGKFWCEFIPIEDVYTGYTKNRNFTGANYYCHHTIKTYESAASEFPKAAGILEGLKQQLASEYEKMKEVGGGVQTSANSDYREIISQTTKQEYKDMIDFWEFWVLKVVPYKKIAFIAPDQTGQPSEQMRSEPIDYEANTESYEREIAVAVDEQWWQYIVAGDEKHHEIINKPVMSRYNRHPFIFECAERKKDGSPRGYVEIVIPHQVRINIAWAQQIAYNNKSIKMPLAVEGVTDLDKAIKQSAFGAVLSLKTGEKILSVNTQPPLNLQAIEEGNSARADMDFAAAATEGVMRGAASAGDSGLKVGIQQNAAITPLNKWVKANKKARLAAARLLLKMIITEWGDKPAQLIRIVGQQKFMELMSPKINPMTGQVTELPMQFPLAIDASQYDVTVIDEAVSDFNKQQTFNAVSALHQMSPVGMFTDEFLIKSAPIKNVDDAIKSNEEHKNDVMQQMMMEIQKLQEQVGELEKAVPKENKPGIKPKNNAANAQRGRNQSQAGQRSMMGGSRGIMQ